MRVQTTLKALRVSNLIHRNYSSTGKLVDIAVDDKNGVATVTMQRPPVNSLNLELLNDLSTALTQLENNKCRGMILTSSSKTVFSAGLDILEMYKPDPDRVRSFWTTLQETWLKLYGSTFPTVAAINGHAPAGGCLLSISCEYRVMVKDYTIGLNETKLGIVAPSWFISSMQNTIDKRTAELALTTGRLFTTEEAHKVHLIDEIAENKEDALLKSQKFLSLFERISPAARTATKLSLRGRDIQALAKNREQDLNLFIGAVTNEKVQKGLHMYIESLKKKKAA